MSCKNNNRFVVGIAYILMLLLFAWEASAESYQYDDVGRLLGVTYEDGSSIAYTYDNAGNILQRQIAVDTTSPTTSSTPSGGNYTSVQSVTLNCDDGLGSGCAVIYYTTDGTVPTTSSSVYSSAISISVNTTLKFFAADNAGNNELVKSEVYVIQITPSNNAPSIITLVSPTDSIINLATTVTFVWEEATDADGDSLTYQIDVCENVNFTGCAPINVAVTETMLWFAGTSGLLGSLMLIGSIGCVGIRKQQWPMVIIASLMIASFVSSCGGSNSSNSVSANQMSHTVSNLKAGTNYYWKVTVSDGTDATESATWNFTTQ